MSKIKFVAMLWLLAGLGWFVGGGTLFVKLRFQMGEESAVMKSVDPVIARALKYNPKDYLVADVVYETSRGNLAVPKKTVGPKDLKALADGTGIPIRFRKGDPYEVLYGNDEKPWGFGSLLLALVCTPLAFFAHRKLKQEAG
jgi:hypothetical protein